MSAHTILTIVDDAAHTQLEATISALLPMVRAERVAPELLRRLPSAAGLVVGDAASARIARATGFAGGIIVLAAPRSAAEHSAFRAQGTEFAGAERNAADIASALGAAIPIGPDGAPGAIDFDVARARQMLAAGEIAFTLQHDLNNPLAALLAEVQLLQMEAPTDEVQETAGRLLDLVRRLTTLIRSLDGVRAPRMNE